MPPVGLKLLHPLKSLSYPITQHFGENPQWYPLTNGHNGMDFGIPLRTPIYATLPGTVVRVGTDASGYGNHVRIQHANNLLSLYGHLDEQNYATVAVGTAVTVGQHIGYSGNTGHSTGPHLHYEVREGSTAFNPEPYLVLKIDGPDPVPAKPIFKVRVTAQPSLNLRSGPSTVYPRIGSLNNGETIDVLDLGGQEVWVRTAKGFIAFRFNGTNLVEVVE